MKKQEEDVWVCTTLGTLGSLHCGQSPTSDSVNASGIGTVYVSGPEQWDGVQVHQSKWTTSPSRCAPANSIFITVKGAGVGTIFLGVEAAIGRDIYAFEPHRDICTRFIFHAIRYSVQDVIAKAHGDIPGLSKSHILDHEISIPGPKTQELVASKIDELFSSIEEGERALERAQKLVERYLQSVLKAAVTGELTREWREQHKGELESGEALLARILKARRETWEKSELAKMKAQGQKPASDVWKRKYQEPVSPNTNDLPELPDGWTWTTVDQLSTTVTSGSRDWKPYYGAGESVFVMAQNVRKRRLDLSEIQLVDPPEGDRDAERSRIQAGDLLMTIVGANTGDVCRVQTPLTNHFVCQSVALIRPIHESLSAYMELFLAAEEGGQAQFKEVVYGAGRPHLSFDQIRGICVPLPPEAEQSEIENRVDVAESELMPIEASVRGSCRAASTLRQSVLKAAFGGQLVPQDPTDEPASVLLQRIGAERAAAPKKKIPARGRKKKTTA